MLKLGVSYFASRHLKHVAEDLKDIKKHHCDWVLHTFDEVDLRFNSGQMKTITSMSHKLGLKVYYSPWAIGGIFGGECISAFPGRHPEACQVLSTGERVPYACPSHPEFRKFMKTWIEAACAAGGDVLFWDEPHLWLPNWEGRPERDDEFSIGSPYAQALFRKKYKKPVPKRKTAEVEEFRDWLLYDFLKWAMQTAKKIRPNIKNAVCLVSHLGALEPPLWNKVASIKELDIVATDPYWKRFPYSNPAKDKMEGYIDLMAGKVVELCKKHGKEPQGWLQIFALRKQDEPDIDKAIRLLHQSGITNIAAWGYEGCNAYSTISSERGRACWDRLGRQYGKLKKKKA
ncbi:MAG: hypothetical protein V4498_08345 [candidate division FCPU426 bacterium]